MMNFAGNIVARAQDPNQNPMLDKNYGGQIKNDETELLNFNFREGRDSDTLNLIDNQNKQLQTGNRSREEYQKQLEQNRNRARDMTNLIKDEELQKAFAKVTVKGKQILHENQALKNPLTVIAGAAALWFGRTINLIRSDTMNLSTRIEARGKSGEFRMESPILNGRLRYESNNGVDLSINRSISSIDSQAELNYNINNRSFDTRFRHHLAPNIDFTFGASQAPASETDGRATLEYRLDF